MHAFSRTKKAFFQRLFLCALLSVPLVLWVTYALHTDTKQAPPPHLPEFTGTVTAPSWAVFNPETGAILFSQGADDVRPIASLTKLFTASVVMDIGSRDVPIVISPLDVATEGRAGSLHAGDTTTLYSLLFPLLIESSNDAATAIQRVLGESYTTSLGKLLKDAGVSHTKITEASGLSEEDVSTVSDLVRFFTFTKKHNPHILDISELYAYRGTHAEYHNNDPAREFSSFRGGKHGYTEAAGRTFVGMFSLDNSSAVVGIVLLGSADLRADIKALLSVSTEPAVSGILKRTP